jgi:hypothetical protein
MTDLTTIKAGTILISNSHSGPTYAQVADCVTTEWGTHLVCVVLGERAGEFETVHNVGAEDMRGIGFKLPTAGDLRRMAGYTSAATE